MPKSLIAVPTITLDGDSDGVAPASNGTSYAAKFSGKRTHRVVSGYDQPVVAVIGSAQA